MLANIKNMREYSRSGAASVSPKCLLHYFLVLKDPDDPLYHPNQVNATTERSAC